MTPITLASEGIRDLIKAKFLLRLLAESLIYE
jgi:hypothetical protein